MKRCLKCNGRFGLIRYRNGLKHLCSKRCLNTYKSDTERKISRIKEWTVFLVGAASVARAWTKPCHSRMRLHTYFIRAAEPVILLKTPGWRMLLGDRLHGGSEGQPT